MKNIKVKNHRELVYEVYRVRVADKLYDAGFKHLAFLVNNRKFEMAELQKFEKSVDKYQISKV